MPFWEHVEELRKRIIIASLFVIAGTIAGYILYPQFVDLMLKTIGEQLFAFQITEGFLVRLKIALAIGLFLSLPIVVFEIVLFILPALKANEKKILLAFLLCSYILFLGGIAFAFQACFTPAIQFFKSTDFYPENVGRMISFTDFFDFFMGFLMAFGICFQFPIVIILLLKFRIVPFRFFLKNFRYFIIVIFIAAAVITPSVDAVTCTFVALPMLALYSLTLLIAKLTGLAKSDKAAP
jgi:sec-independent protein translocase protein TatC